MGKNDKKTAKAALNNKSKDFTKEVLDKLNEKSTLIGGNGAKLGTEYKVVEELDLHESTINGEKTEFLAWRCEGGTDERPVLLTPRRLAEFSAFKDDEDFLATVKWLDDYSAEDAFTLPEDADSIEAEVDAEIDYLNSVDGKVQLIGKAKHPRFANTFVNIYA